MQDDPKWMQYALKEAQKAYEQGEVPVGAVLVFRDEIIAKAHNRVEFLCDATAHAEVLCLQEASVVLGNWRLLECTLYCTLEPCSMCAGAMILSRVSTLVWGARDRRHGVHGSWTNLLDLPHPIHQLNVRTGVLEQESSQLLTQFFRERRECGKAIR